MTKKKSNRAKARAAAAKEAAQKEAEESVVDEDSTNAVEMKDDDDVITESMLEQSVIFPVGLKSLSDEQCVTTGTPLRLTVTRIKKQKCAQVLAGGTTGETHRFTSTGNKLKHAATVVSPVIGTIELSSHDMTASLGNIRNGQLVLVNQQLPVMVWLGKKVEPGECRIVFAAAEDTSLSPVSEQEQKSMVEVTRINQVLPASRITLTPLPSQDGSIVFVNDILRASISSAVLSARLIFTSGMKIGFKILGKIFSFSIRGDLETNDVFEACSTSQVTVLKAPVKQDSEMASAPVLGGLDFVLSSLKTWIAYSRSHSGALKITPPSGVLLYGPPGTGKSLLVKRLCYDLKASFITVEAIDLVSKFVGQAERRLNELFEEAKQAARSLSSEKLVIVFFDEIDALCGSRDDTKADHQNQSVLFTLSAEMDGISQWNQNQKNCPILILGATNRPQAIEPSLRRPGRFEKEIEIGVPTTQSRFEILKKILDSGLPHKLSDEQIRSISKTTHGYVGADLKLLVREATVHLVTRKEFEGKIEYDARDEKELEDELFLEFEDLQAALPKTKPSALREIMVDVPNIRWDDIGGQHDVKMRIREAVEWPITHPEIFEEMGIRPPRGILLYGPPGTGKTMLAKAIATESSMNFIAVKGPELLSKWVGDSEKAIKEVFRKARVSAPSVIFFDEIDSIGTSRSEDSGNSASSRVLSQLLQELDGIGSSSSSSQVIVIGATNVIDSLDRALIRPGRFDQCLYIGPPDLDARIDILKLQLKNVRSSVQDEDIQKIALQIEGSTGAEIASLVREAAMIAIEANLECITSKHLFKALDFVE